MITTNGPTSMRCRLVVPVVLSAVAAAFALGGTASAQAAPLVTAGGSSAVSTAESSTGPVAGRSAARRDVPQIATAWASAWNDGAPEQMAALFTEDGTYQDFAFGASFRGRTEVASWVSRTTTAIDDARVQITDAFGTGDRVSIRFTFSGHIVGAPTPFSVPASAVMELEGSEISYNGDYYNLADVLRQSGLPADR